MEFVSVSIVLYSFLTGFILSRSISDSDMYKLPEPVSKSALNLTSFTFIIATGYVTLALVVTNIGSDLLSGNLSHINVWCLFLHFKQVLALRHYAALCLAPVRHYAALCLAPVRHYAALCLAPVQLKQSFLWLSIFLRFFFQKNVFCSRVTFTRKRQTINQKTGLWITNC